MDIIIRTLLFVGCFVFAFAAVCEDDDTKACEMIALKQPNLCSDPCLSKRCTRFCGNCPVKCYQCHEIDDPGHCTNMITCPSTDHYCYTTQTFTDDFTEVYKMGCAMKDVCQSYLGPDHRRNIDVNGACCMEDKCNNRLPLVIITADRLPTQPPSGSSNGTIIDPTVCQNVDDMACKQFAATKPDVCSDTCFATNVCPRMCGKCFNCFTCNDIDKVNDCNATNVCKAGQECFMLETLSADLRQVFRVGCMEEQLCSRFQANSGTAFGRRDGFSLKGGCCKSDLCNDHFEVINQPTTTTTTQAPSGCQHGYTHCPAGFLATGYSCYKIGPKRMTWSEAKNYCGTHCGRLVDFKSRQEMYDVFKLLVPHHNGHYQDERVWTDATYSASKAMWLWSHSNQGVDSTSFRHLTGYHNNKDNCAFALVHSVSHNFQRPTTVEDVLPGYCNEDYFPLCEATRHH